MKTIKQACNIIAKRSYDCYIASFDNYSSTSDQMWLIADIYEVDFKVVLKLVNAKVNLLKKTKGIKDTSGDDEEDGN